VNDLTQITSRLAHGGVDFILVGGLASLIHGGSLMTQDVDIVCPMTPKSLLRLFDAIADLEPRHRMTPQRSPLTPEQLSSDTIQNLYLTTSWGQLDCLGNIKGVGDYSACLERSEQIHLGDCDVRVLQLDALIDAKRAMGRPRDLHTLLELAAILERKSEMRPPEI